MFIFALILDEFVYLYDTHVILIFIERKAGKFLTLLTKLPYDIAILRLCSIRVWYLSDQPTLFELLLVIEVVTPLRPII